MACKMRKDGLHVCAQMLHRHLIDSWEGRCGLGANCLLQGQDTAVNHNISEKDKMRKEGPNL